MNSTLPVIGRREVGDFMAELVLELGGATWPLLMQDRDRGLGIVAILF